MAVVNLTEQEWGAVMAIIATAPWRDANPLLMKIGEQLRNQTLPNPFPATGHGELKQGASVGDGLKEAGHEPTH